MTFYRKLTPIIERASNTLLNNLFLLFFIGDFLTRIIRLNSKEFHSYGSLLKLFVQIVFIIYFLNKKKWNSKIAIYVYIFIVIFIIGQINYFFIHDYTLLFSNLFRLNTYLYIFLILIIIEGHDIKSIVINNIKIVKKIGEINILFTILGLLFKIELFRSYAYSERFGSMGILPSPGSASYFYIFLISILYIDYTNRGNKLKASLILLVQIVIACMLGTKIVIFFLILLSLFHFCFLIKKTIIKNTIKVIFLLSIALVYIFRNNIEIMIMETFSFSKEIYNEYGIITILFSTRDLFFYKSINYLKDNGNAIMYLFGGLNREELNVEFEFYKMFMFFGILGVIVYLHFLRKYFFSKNNNDVKKYIFLAIIFSASFAGGLFYSVVSSFLFFIVLKYSEIMLNQENL